MSECTEEAWEIRLSNHQREWYAWIQDVKDRRLLAAIACTPEQEAIANLIVTAPKMLTLLKDILEWDGILPHSKTRIRDMIAEAEKK